MAENVSSVTDNSFQAEVIDASQAQPVMVDFWADWCRPVPHAGAHGGGNRGRIRRQAESGEIERG